MKSNALMETKDLFFLTLSFSKPKTSSLATGGEVGINKSLMFKVRYGNF